MYTGQPVIIQQQPPQVYMVYLFAKRGEALECTERERLSESSGPCAAVARHPYLFTLRLQQQQPQQIYVQQPQPVVVMVCLARPPRESEGSLSDLTCDLLPPPAPPGRASGILQQQQPQSVMVVTTGSGIYGKMPCPTTCPFCRNSITTSVIVQPGCFTYESLLTWGVARSG